MLSPKAFHDRPIPMSAAAGLIAGMTQAQAGHHGVAVIIEAVELGGGAGPRWSVRDLAMALAALRERLQDGVVPAFVTAPPEVERSSSGVLNRTLTAAAARADVVARAMKLAPNAGDRFKLFDFCGHNQHWTRRVLVASGEFRFEKGQAMHARASAWFAVRVKGAAG